MLLQSHRDFVVTGYTASWQQKLTEIGVNEYSSNNGLLRSYCVLATGDAKMSKMDTILFSWDLQLIVVVPEALLGRAAMLKSFSK